MNRLKGFHALAFSLLLPSAAFGWGFDGGQKTPETPAVNEALDNITDGSLAESIRGMRLAQSRGQAREKECREVVVGYERFCVIHDRQTGCSEWRTVPVTRIVCS